MLILALVYWDGKFLVHFLGELKKPKSPFEIKWPLEEKEQLSVQKLELTFYSVTVLDVVSEESL